MHDIGNDYLMMIEPKDSCPKTGSFKELLGKATAVEQRVKHLDIMTKGVHTCYCGEVSDNLIYKTPMGRETNSLLVHYIQHHNDIPQCEIQKLNEEYEYILDNQL